MAHMLAITDQTDQQWLNSLKTITDVHLDVVRLDDVEKYLSLNDYCIVFADETHVTDIEDFIMRVENESHDPATKVIVISNAPTHSDMAWKLARDAFEAGAVDYINTSIPPDDLDIILKNAISDTLEIQLHQQRARAQGLILFVDNLEDLVKARQELLERAGYQVRTATTFSDAKTFLEEHEAEFSLAILDVRMIDDNDPNDLSGLQLAELAPSVRKIIITQYPTTEKARDALKVRPGKAPKAVKFLAKEEGFQALLNTINKILA